MKGVVNKMDLKPVSLAVKYIMEVVCILGFLLILTLWVILFSGEPDLLDVLKYKWSGNETVLEGNTD